VAGSESSGPLMHSPLFLRRQRAGFTLLELLIVVFIISLISAGFVKLMVGFGGVTQSLEDETRRLQRLLTLAAQQAILDGAPMGLLIEANAYYFVAAGEKYWLTVKDDDLLQRHPLPQGWRLALWQDGKRLPPVEANVKKDELGEKAEQPEPSIIFYDSGEMTPFELRIYAADNSEPTVIEADENGEVEVRFPEPER